MAKEEFTKEMYDKSIEVALKLTKVLMEEEYDNCSTTFMMFCVARFTAGILVTLQKFSNDINLGTEYTNLVKKMMDDMGGTANTQAVKEQIKENSEEFAKMNLSEEDILRMVLDTKNKKGS